MPTGSNAPARPDELASRDDSAFDLIEVPAAVVCAACGNPDCSGCGLEEQTNASGVVAIIPWERPGVGVFRRLWQTSFLATTHARTFFGALPEGDVSSALAFALICETVAVAGLGIGASVLALAFLPELPRLLLDDRALLKTVMRGFAFGGLLLVLAMVSVHAAHGLSLDFAARRHGTRKRGRGLRFGLYACGWDLITLPFGLLTLALVEGIATARRAVPLGLTAPLQSAEAYLVGVHGLAPETARAAARRAARLTAVPLLAALAVGALVVGLVR
ncbi:MAG TPA: hypothetical protein VK745_23450 [Polyangiaceae bacterium]|nr:hypothetical protein [Polyangiaceae bacterium]